MRINRVVGDEGPAARIELTLTDLNDDPITEGPVTLRASGLFEGAMSGGTGGVWHYDPVEGDLDARGIFGLEVSVDGVTIPSEKPHDLVVRDRVAAPEGS